MDLHLPDIPGITARPYGRPGDAQLVADLVVAEARADGRDDAVDSAHEVELTFRTAENLDLEHGFRFVEVDGEAVAYVITRWYDEVDGPRAYRHLCKVKAEWRNQGIGTAMLRWAQERLAALADGHEIDRPKVFRTGVDTTESGAEPLLEAAGYRAVAHDAELVRPHLDDIPDLGLPDGLEVRPVEESHLRTIWEADVEAFRDHWGFVEPTDKDWQAFLEFPYRDESLWKVAWDGDRVAGQVRSFINERENEELGRRRGWAEFISTGREWRGRGVASGLICASLRELRDRGMEEAALGVHVENPHGAYRLYQGLGFEVTDVGTTYEKPFS
jgi:ribosomal protein S18 acetylase RimI-like enzyme